MTNVTTRIFALLLLCGGILGCVTNDSVKYGVNFEEGDVVYTRVGMRFEVRSEIFVMYSTNFLGMPDHLPPNTRLRVDSGVRKGLHLRDDMGRRFLIRWTAKHHGGMSLGEWIARHFSNTPVSLPEDLTEAERDAIAAGTPRVGISRAALELAIGYPPKTQTLTLDSSDRIAMYQWTRFENYRIEFDESGQVVSIGR